MPTPASSYPGYYHSTSLTQLPQKRLHLFSGKVLQDLLQFLKWSSRWFRRFDVAHKEFFLSITIKSTRPRITSASAKETIEALRQEITHTAASPDSLDYPPLE